MELTVGAHRGGLVNTRSLRFALSVFSVLTVIMRTARVAATPGGAKFGGQFEESEDDQLPRILTVLTTYSGRSDFVTAYRDAAGARNDLVRLLNMAKSWARKDSGRCFGFSGSVKLRLKLLMHSWKNYRS